MIYSDYLAEEKVENTCRENELPETDEVEPERYALEVLVLFDSFYDFL